MSGSNLCYICSKTPSQTVLGHLKYRSQLYSILTAAPSGWETYDLIGWPLLWLVDTYTFWPSVWCNLFTSSCSPQLLFSWQNKAFVKNSYIHRNHHNTMSYFILSTLLADVWSALCARVSAVTTRFRSNICEVSSVPGYLLWWLVSGPIYVKCPLCQGICCDDRVQVQYMWGVFCARVSVVMTGFRSNICEVPSVPGYLLWWPGSGPIYVRCLLCQGICCDDWFQVQYMWSALCARVSVVMTGFRSNICEVSSVPGYLLWWPGSGPIYLKCPLCQGICCDDRVQVQYMWSALCARVSVVMTGFRSNICEVPSVPGYLLWWPGSGPIYVKHQHSCTTRNIYSTVLL